MKDDYYSRQIQRCINDLEIISLAISISIMFIDFENERKRYKLRLKVNKFMGAELSKADRNRGKIYDWLDKNVDSTSHVSLSDVKNEINKRLKYGKQLEDNVIDNLAHKIARNPAQALNDFLSEYVNSKRKIKRLEQLKIEDSKKKDDGKASLVKTEESKSKSTTYTSSESVGTFQPVNSVNKPFTPQTLEESRRLLIAEIDKEIRSEQGTFGLSYKAQKRIKELYPELDSNHPYYCTKTLSDGIIVETIANKKTIETDDIMKMGLLTLKIVTDELLFGTEKINKPELFNKYGVGASFEKYEKAYDKYMKYYNGLSSDEKEQVDKQVKSNKNYVMNFGETVATPEKVKNTINNRVKDYLVKNHMTYFGQNNEIYTKISHATKYMDIENIVALYKNIKIEYEKYDIYVDSEERQDSKYLTELQTEIARVIKYRLEMHNKAVDTKSMDKEEKNDYYREENKKLAAIIIDLFKEMPLDTSLKKIADEYSLVGNGEKLLETFKAKNTAKTRVYEVSRVTKAFAKISGKWSRYLMLMEKNDLSKQEQEELNRMFR